MADNPLQKFFRQPKIYISLPSKGIYNDPGTFQGEVENIPIYGMTGMDEILMKTPDALLSGESTVKIFESCCPSIKNGWAVNALDTDVLLTAIRIATYGNSMSVVHTCPKCSLENEYEIDLGLIIEHFSNCKYDNKVVLKDISIKLQPLTYQQTTEFSLKNFQLQQKLKQTDIITDEEEKKKILAKLFHELGLIQQEIFSASVESVDIGTSVVSEKSFIQEWLENCDKSVFDAIKDKFNKNKEAWRIPKVKVQCTSCEYESNLTIDLDQTSFFANA